MRLPFLHSKQAPDAERGRAAAGAPPQDAAQARTRARQRLVGAVVLLAAGVIGFPILFETQPRPLALDTPIEIVRQEGRTVTAPAAAGRVQPVTLPPPDAGIETAVAASAAVPTPAAPASPPAATVPTAQPPTLAAPASAAAPVVPKPPKEAPARERPVPAIPANTPPAAASVTQSGRFVVQAGAYLDAASLREARQKVEKLGLKTYTQEVDTPTGKRTRVRVGPFESRPEADGVAARIKATGLSVVVLTL